MYYEISIPIERGIAGATGLTVAGAGHVFAGREMKRILADAVLGFVAAD